ncbi:MAG: glycosyltransferase [Bacteroidales bacterium]|nr:glycosyltransferase [Bacteroidales bacterium]
MNKKVLFFFTASYPYGKDETFIEYEIEDLCRHYQKIIIISNSKEDGTKRRTPENTILLNFPYNLSFFEKIAALKEIFSPIYKNEVAIIKDNPDLLYDRKIKNILLTSVYKAKKIRTFLMKAIREHVPNNSEACLYSYWMNDMAIGCALTKSDNPKIQFISRVHGWDLYFERHSPPYLPLRTFICHKADKIIFISEQSRKYFINKNRILNTLNLEVSYLGTKRLNEPKDYCKNDTFHIVSCSSVIPLKQLEKIAESIAGIKTSQSIKWTHLGGGQCLNEIIALTENLFKGKTHLSYFFSGSISNNKVHDFYVTEKVDLFINASCYEGLPVSIMEAFSYGIPAIAPDIGGISEIIDHQKNGFLLPSKPTKEDISSAMKSFIELSEAEILEYRKNAMEKWDVSFNAVKNFKEDPFL